VSWQIDWSGTPESLEEKNVLIPLYFMRTSTLLSEGARMVYMQIKSHARNKNFSQDHIMRYLNMTRNTFYKHLKELKYFGFLTTSQVRSQDKKFLITKYKLYACSHTFPAYIMELDSSSDCITNWKLFRSWVLDIPEKERKLLFDVESIEGLAVYQKLHIGSTKKWYSPSTKNWYPPSTKNWYTIVTEEEEQKGVIESKDPLILTEREEKAASKRRLPRKVNISDLQSTDTVVFDIVMTDYLMEEPFHYSPQVVKKSRTTINRMLRAGVIDQSFLDNLTEYFTTCEVEVPELKLLLKESDSHLTAFEKIKFERLKRRVDSCLLSEHFLESSQDFLLDWNALKRSDIPKSWQQCEELLEQRFRAGYIAMALRLLLHVDNKELIFRFYETYREEILENFRKFTFTVKQLLDTLPLPLNKIPQLGPELVRIHSEKVELQSKFRIADSLLGQGQRIDKLDDIELQLVGLESEYEEMFKRE
jgi:hypothetical protein